MIATSEYLNLPVRTIETAARDRWGGAWLTMLLRLEDGLPVYDGALLVEAAAVARRARELV